MPLKELSFKFDVVGMGLNAVDHICLIPRFPKYEEKLRMLDFKKAPGGQVALVAPPGVAQEITRSFP